MSTEYQIKIIGVDPKRRPNLNNKKYIDVFYELSEKASKDWCVEFNLCISKHKKQVRINPDIGLYIDTWVHGMYEIPEFLDSIKAAVIKCNSILLERAQNEEAARKHRDIENRGAEHTELEKILQSLKFD